MNTYDIHGPFQSVVNHVSLLMDGLSLGHLVIDHLRDHAIPTHTHVLRCFFALIPQLLASGWVFYNDKMICYSLQNEYIMCYKWGPLAEDTNEPAKLAIVISWEIKTIFLSL